VLAGEIGLVGCGVEGAGNRRGAAYRKKQEQLELAGNTGSAFENISKQLSEQAERQERHKKDKELEYREALLDQLAEKIEAKHKAREVAVVNRDLEDEVSLSERANLERIRDSKIRELQGFGVPAHHLRMLQELEF